MEVDVPVVDPAENYVGRRRLPLVMLADSELRDSPPSLDAHETSDEEFLQLFGSAENVEAEVAAGEEVESGTCAKFVPSVHDEVDDATDEEVMLSYAEAAASTDGEEASLITDQC